MGARVGEAHKAHAPVAAHAEDMPGHQRVADGRLLPGGQERGARHGQQQRRQHAAPGGQRAPPLHHHAEGDDAAHDQRRQWTEEAGGAPGGAGHHPVAGSAGTQQPHDGQPADDQQPGRRNVRKVRSGEDADERRTEHEESRQASDPLAGQLGAQRDRRRDQQPAGHRDHQPGHPRQHTGQQQQREARRIHGADEWVFVRLPQQAEEGEELAMLGHG